MAKSKALKVIISSILCSSLMLSFTGCGEKTTNSQVSSENKSIKEITELAKKEGEVISVGMPDSWANWKGTWEGITSEYGIKHTDTDMSSAEEISKFLAEKDKATSDIGDVGISFGPIAVAKGVTQAYKTSYWNDIPEWAKDKDGHWVVGYTGSIAILTNKKLIKNPPKSWKDILNGDYKVAIGDVTTAAQAQASILAAAIAHGGDEKNIQPGIDYFAKLAKQGRLSMTDPGLSTLEKGEVEVALLWDFNALGYRDKLGKDNYVVCIPEEGSLISGYATIINKYAPHPNAGMLAREYILSDKGQINLAKGYARPIRSNVKLPDDVKAKMIPDEQYKKVKPVKDFEAWAETAKQIPQLWQEQVLINVK